MPVGEEEILAYNLGHDTNELTFDYFGLNHLGWFTGIYDKEGHDLLPKLIEKVKTMELI